MKPTTPIANDEQLNQALEFLSEHPDDDEDTISNALSEYWSENGRWLKAPFEDLDHLIGQFAVETPEDFDPSEHEEDFLKAIGFNHPFSEPNHFCWGGHGDVYWLITWGTGNFKADLEKWINEEHEKVIASAEYEREHRAELINDAINDAYEQGRQISDFEAARLTDRHIAYEKGGPL
jgi:hypothetical protein